MATYRTKENGAIVLSESELSGNWILEEEYEKLLESQVDEHNPNDLTVPELKSKLDELGIEYSDKAKKAELLALLEAHKE